MPLYLGEYSLLFLIVGLAIECAKDKERDLISVDHSQLGEDSNYS